ncbi:unnamed protein product [Amoebophrya sp. A120]|nr:unnamed protein product [Amoebophrya sp. A120]|eukprot:GSA120T00003458001.1
MSSLFSTVLGKNADVHLRNGRWCQFLGLYILVVIMIISMVVMYTSSGASEASKQLANSYECPAVRPEGSDYGSLCFDTDAAEIGRGLDQAMPINMLVMDLAFRTWFAFLLPLWFVFTGFGNLVFEETGTKLYDVQVLYGLPRGTYWLANAFFFGLIYAVPLLLVHVLRLILFYGTTAGLTRLYAWPEVLSLFFAPLPVIVAVIFLSSTLAVSIEKETVYRPTVHLVGFLNGAVCVGLYVTGELYLPNRGASFLATAFAQDMKNFSLEAINIVGTKEYSAAATEKLEEMIVAKDPGLVSTCPNTFLGLPLALNMLAGVVCPGFSYVRIMERGAQLLRVLQDMRHRGTSPGWSSQLQHETPASAAAAKAVADEGSGLLNWQLPQGRPFWNSFLMPHSLYYCARDPSNPHPPVDALIGPDESPIWISTRLGAGAEGSKVVSFERPELIQQYADNAGAADLGANNGAYVLFVICDHLTLLLNALFWYGVLRYRLWCKDQAEQGDTAVTNAGAANTPAGVVLAHQQQPLLPQNNQAFPGGVGADDVLRIDDLTKSFGGKLANNHVSFSVHRGEIFCLLGHNGAGKTTLVGQITGLLQRTSGNIFIDGVSVADQPEAARHKVTLCPQHNAMWDAFTCRQHIVYFAHLRGIPEAEIAESLNRYAWELGIYEKLDTLCEKLSGGQKRRMWVLCSLLGKEVPLILMDEPTSGMDPQTRRDFWLLLKKLVSEERKTVVFSTHYLEEADLLAERKVILAAGRVRALGSSVELKHQFGLGFWVQASVTKGAVSEQEAQRILEQDVRRAVAAVVFAAPTARPEDVQVKASRVSAYFRAYLVPWAAVVRIPALLDALEAQFPALSVTVEQTTMEEVFQIVGEQAEDEEHAADSALDPAAKRAQQERDRALSRQPLRARVLTFGNQASSVFKFRFLAETLPSYGSHVFPLLVLATLWFFAFHFKVTESDPYAQDGGSLSLGQDGLTKLIFSGSTPGPGSLFFFFLIAQAFGPLQSRSFLQYQKERDEGILQHLTHHGCQRGAYHFGSISAYLLFPYLPYWILFLLAFLFAGGSWWFASGGFSVAFVFLVWLPGLLLSVLVPVTLGLFMGSRMHTGVVCLAFAMLIVLEGWEAGVTPHRFEALDPAKSTLKEHPPSCLEAFWDLQEGSQDLPSSPALKGFGRLASFAFPHLALENSFRILLQLRTALHLAPLASHAGSGSPSTQCLTMYFSRNWDQMSAESEGPGFVESAWAAVTNQDVESTTPAQEFMKQLYDTCGFSSFLETSPTSFVQTLQRGHGAQNADRGLLTDSATTNATANSKEAVVDYHEAPPPSGVVTFKTLNPDEDTASSAEVGGGAEPEQGDQLSSSGETTSTTSGTEESVQHFGTAAYYFVGSVPEGSPLAVMWGAGVGGKCSAVWSPGSAAFGGVWLPVYVLSFWVLLFFLLEKCLAHRRVTAAGAAREELPRPEPLQDADVAAEEARWPRDRDAVDVQGVYKKFVNPDGKPHWASKGVTLGIQPGECFGLLGPNGAGKTTLFNMMSGNDETGPPNLGSIHWLGKNTADDGFELARQHMGLAPQFDKLWPDVSGRLHLRIYAQVAGLYAEETADHVVEAGPPGGAPLNRPSPLDVEAGGAARARQRSDAGEERISRFLREVGLSEKDADRPTKEYSGGMKRKLSVALTMITDPPIVFLDEMSAGVDISAQRTLWDKLINRPTGQTIVTISHSMSEIDATADRIGILVAGRLKCLGDSLRLKQVYGNGYHLEVVLNLGKQTRKSRSHVLTQECVAPRASLADAQRAIAGGDGGKQARPEGEVSDTDFTEDEFLQMEDGGLSGDVVLAGANILSEKGQLQRGPEGEGSPRSTKNAAGPIKKKKSKSTILDNTAAMPQQRFSQQFRRSVDEKIASPVAGKDELSVETVEMFLVDSLMSYNIGIPRGEIHVLEKTPISSARVRLCLGLGVHVDRAGAAAKGGQGNKSSLRLSSVFKWCVQDPLKIIEDFGVGEPTLEQVFLKFAKEQELHDQAAEGAANGGLDPSHKGAGGPPGFGGKGLPPGGAVGFDPMKGGFPGGGKGGPSPPGMFPVKGGPGGKGMPPGFDPQMKGDPSGKGKGLPPMDKGDPSGKGLPPMNKGDLKGGLPPMDKGDLKGLPPMNKDDPSGKKGLPPMNKGDPSGKGLPQKKGDPGGKAVPPGFFWFDGDPNGKGPPPGFYPINKGGKK